MQEHSHRLDIEVDVSHRELLQNLTFGDALAQLGIHPLYEGGPLEDAADGVLEYQTTLVPNQIRAALPVRSIS